ncbi:MAG: PhoH family protein, partial [Oscillospiraceae bacterium]
MGDEENISLAERTIQNLIKLIKKGERLNEQNVRYVMTMVEQGTEKSLASITGDCIYVTIKGKPIKAKTVGQKQYVDAMRANTITFGVGPAGTGKTYLAVALAVKALREEKMSRIILTRPAVEAGEKLGFLPGDLQDKVDP